MPSQTLSNIEIYAEETENLSGHPFDISKNWHAVQISKDYYIIRLSPHQYYQFYTGFAKPRKFRGLSDLIDLNIIHPRLPDDSHWYNKLLNKLQTKDSPVQLILPNVKKEFGIIPEYSPATIKIFGPKELTDKTKKYLNLGISSKIPNITSLEYHPELETTVFKTTNAFLLPFGDRLYSGDVENAEKCVEYLQTEVRTRANQIKDVITDQIISQKARAIIIPSIQPGVLQYLIEELNKNENDQFIVRPVKIPTKGEISTEGEEINDEETEIVEETEKATETKEPVNQIIPAGLMSLPYLAEEDLSGFDIWYLDIYNITSAPNEKEEPDYRFLWHRALKEQYLKWLGSYHKAPKTIT